MNNTYSTCAICGGPIIKYSSRDHVFPIAILKWSYAANEKLTQKDFNRLEYHIKHKNNVCKTHPSCNFTKRDMPIEIKDLHVSNNKRNALITLRKQIEPYIIAFENMKSDIYEKQNGQCYDCQNALDKNDMAIRRIDNHNPRTYENACLVCYHCNLKMSYTRAKQKRKERQEQRET